MKCRLCKTAIMSPVLNLGAQPLANKYPQTSLDISNEKKFEMKVNYCPVCYSMQLEKLISRDLMFKDYYYLSSVNKELVQHFTKLADQIKHSRFVLDIGSNDGVLLKPLKDLGVNAVGIDPSENVSLIANKNGFRTITGFFDNNTAEKIISIGGKPDCIVASSVFTHLEDIDEFLEVIGETLSDDGVFIVEVEYLGDLISKLEFERFYFDRPNYFSLKSLISIFERNDFVLFDAELIKPHGGSLRVYVKHKKTNKDNVSKGINEILKHEESLLQSSKIQSFSYDVNVVTEELKEKLIEFLNIGLNVVGYGAPARLSTITNYGNIDNSLINYIIDDSPLKAGRFSPGQHIPIYGFDYLYKEPPDIIIVFAYEYFESIYKKTNKFDVKYFKAIPPIQLKGN
jgi:methylation protein EvaC